MMLWPRLCLCSIIEKRERERYKFELDTFKPKKYTSYAHFHQTLVKLTEVAVASELVVALVVACWVVVAPVVVVTTASDGCALEEGTFDG